MRILTVAFFATLSCVLGAQWARGESSGCVPHHKKNSAFRFPVVLKGQAWLKGRPINRIEAWSVKSGRWSKIPLQIDEVNLEGSYVLEGGLPFTSNSDDGIYDSNDELSIKGTSIGESFTSHKVPVHLRKDFKDFARVDFCGEKDGYLGSIFLGELTAPKISEPVKPLFDPATGVVESSKYKYIFRKEQPMLIGDVLIMTGSGPKQVFAGSSFVMPLLPRLFLFPSMYFGEQDFTSEVESWRTGPIRSIVAVGAKMRRFFGMVNLHLFSELVFYEDYFQIPTQIEFIFDPSRFLNRGSGLSYILKYPEDSNWTLTSNLDPLPPSGPVEGSLKKTAYDQSPSGIYSVLGHSELGSFMANVRVDSKALKLAPPPYLALDKDFANQELQSRWPWLKKSSGSLAVFIDISGVKRGLYDFALDVALSNQADDGFTDFQAVSANWHEPTNF